MYNFSVLINCTFSFSGFSLSPSSLSWSKKEFRDIGPFGTKRNFMIWDYGTLLVIIMIWSFSSSGEHGRSILTCVQFTMIKFYNLFLLAIVKADNLVTTRLEKVTRFPLVQLSNQTGPLGVFINLQTCLFFFQRAFLTGQCFVNIFLQTRYWCIYIQGESCW